MSTSLLLNSKTTLPPSELKTALKSAQHYAEASMAQNTLRQYEGEWAQFVKWCQDKKVTSLPCKPLHLAAWLADLADQGYKPNTIHVKAAAVRKMHEVKKYDIPNNSSEVTTVLKGIRRAKAKAGIIKTPTKPLIADNLRIVVHAINRHDVMGLRDRLILLLGFGSALRRSELSALKIEHLEWHDKGVLIRIPLSKGDQEGKGATVAVPPSKNKDFCPITALTEWIQCLGDQGITTGFLLRSLSKSGRIDQSLLSRSAHRLKTSEQRQTGLADFSINRIIKQRSQNVGLRDAELYSAHSLRAGFGTDAILKGKNVGKVRDHMRHASIETTFQYVHDQEIWEENPAEGLL